MPCKQCKDGKYKWGNTGECKYATKDECEKANPKNYKEMKNKPTPLGKKTYEEYAKELKEFNLSAEPKLTKVELGLVDDISKKAFALNNLLKSAKEEYDKTFKEVSKAYSMRENLAKDSVKLQKQAKELGINTKDIPAYKEAEKALKKFDSDSFLKKFI